MLLLFDVDGTLLLRAADAHKEAFHVALHEVFGIEDARAFRVATPGKTDLQIAREVLLQAGYDARAIDDRIDALGEAWCRAHAERQPEIADRVAPGMRDLLGWLAGQDKVCLSLLTGNLEPIARLKLACAGLDQFIAFDLGAYGSDHADRTCLVPIVRDRLRHRLGPARATSDIVVVGDTPRDIACARAGGARVVAVATGSYSRAELEAHHPDAVLDDLSDTESVVACLLGVRAAVQ
jgi:phosphoglycolate phosphatase